MLINLEPFNSTDHTAIIQKWEAQNEHQQYLTHLWPRYLRNNQPERAASTRLYLIKADESYAGHCWLEEIDGISAKLGIFIAPEYRNQKIGRKAIVKLKELAANELELESIYLNVRQNNPRAISCYQKCCFEIVRENPPKTSPNGQITKSYKMTTNF